MTFEALFLGALLLGQTLMCVWLFHDRDRKDDRIAELQEELDIGRTVNRP